MYVPALNSPEINYSVLSILLYLYDTGESTDEEMKLTGVEPEWFVSRCLVSFVDISSVAYFPLTPSLTSPDQNMSLSQANLILAHMRRGRVIDLSFRASATLVRSRSSVRSSDWSRRTSYYHHAGRKQFGNPNCFIKVTDQADSKEDRLRCLIQAGLRVRLNFFSEKTCTVP